MNKNYFLLSLATMTIFLFLVSFSTAASCTLKNVQINPHCSAGGCRNGNTIELSAEVEGDCPSVRHLQIDAMSTDGGCDIQYFAGNAYLGGDISGIYDRTPEVSGNTVSGEWSVSGTNKCLGKTIEATQACIYSYTPQSTIHPLSENNQIACADASGSFEFSEVGYMGEYAFVKLLKRKYKIDYQKIRDELSGPESKFSWGGLGKWVGYKDSMYGHDWTIGVSLQSPFHSSGTVYFKKDDSEVNKMPRDFIYQFIEEVPFEPQPTEQECKDQGFMWRNEKCNAVHQGHWRCQWYDNAKGCNRNCYWYDKEDRCLAPVAWNIPNKEDCESFTREIWKELQYMPSFYWYNEGCHRGKPSCDKLNNKEECNKFNCKWFDNACYKKYPCDYYESRGNCPDSCYWYDYSCHSEKSAWSHEVSGKAKNIECIKYENKWTIKFDVEGYYDMTYANIYRKTDSGGNDYVGITNSKWGNADLSSQGSSGSVVKTLNLDVSSPGTYMALVSGQDTNGNRVSDKTIDSFTVKCSEDQDTVVVEQPEKPITEITGDEDYNFFVELYGDYATTIPEVAHSSVVLEDSDHLGYASASDKTSKCEWTRYLSQNIDISKACGNGVLEVEFSDNSVPNGPCSANHRVCVYDGSEWHCCGKECTSYHCTNSVYFDCSDWSCSSGPGDNKPPNEPDKLYYEFNWGQYDAKIPKSGILREFPLNPTLKTKVSDPDGDKLDVKFVIWSYEGDKEICVDKGVSSDSWAECKITGLGSGEYYNIRIEVSDNYERVSTGSDWKVRCKFKDTTTTVSQGTTTVPSQSTTTIEEETTSTISDQGGYPSGEISVDENQVVKNEKFTITVTGQDDQDVLYIGFSTPETREAFTCEGTQKRCSHSWTLSKPSSGTYRYTGLVMDSEGQQSYTSPRNIYISVGEGEATTSIQPTTTQPTTSIQPQCSQVTFPNLVDGNQLVYECLPYQGETLQGGELYTYEGQTYYLSDYDIWGSKEKTYFCPSGQHCFYKKVEPESVEKEFHCENQTYPELYQGKEVVYRCLDYQDEKLTRGDQYSYQGQTYYLSNHDAWGQSVIKYSCPSGQHCFYELVRP